MRLLSSISLLVCLVGISSCSTIPQSQSTENNIRAVLDTQVDAWNAGDIETFMSGYVKSEQLRFAGASGVRRGYTATLNRYRKAYPSKSAMGQLRFSDLEIKSLSRRYAEVFGRYHLRRGGRYKNASGMFTLLFEKKPEGWLIVHDHSSALE